MEAVDECVRLLLELCEDGVIGFDAEFTKSTGSNEKLIALMQFVITFPVTRHTSSASEASTHDRASPSSTPPNTSAAAAATPIASTSADPGPAYPYHATSGTLAADIGDHSTSQPAQQNQPNRGIPTPRGKGRCRYRRPPCVFLLRLSKLGYLLTESLIHFLRDPRLVWVTVNFKSGDGPSLRLMLLQQFTDLEVQAMDDLMVQQFDLQILTSRGVATWGTALLGCAWGKLKLDSRLAWVVSVQVYQQAISLDMHNVARSWLCFDD